MNNNQDPKECECICHLPGGASNRWEEESYVDCECGRRMYIPRIKDMVVTDLKPDTIIVCVHCHPDTENIASVAVDASKHNKEEPPTPQQECEQNIIHDKCDKDNPCSSCGHFSTLQQLQKEAVAHFSEYMHDVIKDLTKEVWDKARAAKVEELREEVEGMKKRGEMRFTNTIVAEGITREELREATAQEDSEWRIFCGAKREGYEQAREQVLALLSQTKDKE